MAPPQWRDGPISISIARTAGPSCQMPGAGGDWTSAGGVRLGPVHPCRLPTAHLWYAPRVTPGCWCAGCPGGVDSMRNLKVIGKALVDVYDNMFVLLLVNL